MSASVFGTRRTWSGERNAEGHRTYRVIHLVQSSASDGPYQVMRASGLPFVGSPWNFGNDFDPWAFCYPTMKVSIYDEIPGDRSSKLSEKQFWLVEQTFSTKPLKRCQDESIEDPLMEPSKYGGSFVKYLEEAQEDKDGNKIKTSSHELVTGPQVEFDANRPAVWVEQNVASLGLSTFAQMVDTVNDGVLWGLPARTVKLSNVTWERKIYGLCNFYYTRRFEFDIRYNTFDRSIVDSGTKALGYWNPQTKNWVTEGDANDPGDFKVYKDKRGENCRVFLDGSGAPLTDGANPVNIPLDPVKRYGESNFLTLGVPTSF